jgi:hypothetical protein
MAIHPEPPSTLDAGEGSHHSSKIIIQLLLGSQDARRLMQASDLYHSTGI